MITSVATAILIVGLSGWLIPLGIYQWRTAEKTAAMRQQAYEEEGDPIFGTLVAGAPWYRSASGLRVLAASALIFGLLGLVMAALTLAGVLPPSNIFTSVAGD